MSWEHTQIFPEFIMNWKPPLKIVFQNMYRKLTAETPWKFTFKKHIKTLQKNSQKFLEVPHNPNITRVKGNLPVPCGLKTKNRKPQLNFGPDYSALTLNHTKIKNSTKTTWNHS